MAQQFDVDTVPLEGTQLVEASAGTGKTYAISTLVVRLLVETNWTLDRLLVVTFTEAATAELKERVRRRIKEAFAKDGHPKLEAALRDFDNAAIFTIHGFCQRALQENAFASHLPFDTELVTDARPLLQEIVLDFWAREVGPAARIFVEHLRDRGVGPDQLQALSSWVARAPRLQFVPRPDAGDGAAAGSSFGAVDATSLRESFLRAKDAYDETAVLRILNTANIRRHPYPVRWLPNWCRAIAEMFEQQRELPKLPKHFEKFHASTLLAASRSEPPEHPFFAAAEALAAEVFAMHRRLEAEEVRFYRAFVRCVQRELVVQKQARGILTFDDLVHGLSVALDEQPNRLAANLRERFPVALIDEFQDTDPLQYSIFQRVWGRHKNPMFLVGDPKQAIYSFRGADVFAYLEAARAVPEARRFTMPRNYRSDAALVTAVNGLFSQAPDPFFLRELHFHEVRARPDAPAPPAFPPELGEAPLQFRFLRRPVAKDGSGKVLPFGSPNDRLVPECVAAEVVRMLNAGVLIGAEPLSPKHIAILTRTNAQAFECQRALQQASVPSVVLGDKSVFSYDEARELQLLLAAAMEPQSPRRLRAALSTELLGLQVSDLLELDLDEGKWDEWAERFRRYHQRWSSDGFVQMIRGAMEECGIPTRLLGFVDGERRMTNLLHLIELLHVESKRQHLGPSGLLHLLAELRSQSEGLSPDAEQVRLESDEDTVTITTIHKSKGLEYGVVLCPFPSADFLVMNEDTRFPRFHDHEREGTLSLDLGSAAKEAHLELMQDEAHAENLRLLYVALTRAKHRTILFWCARRAFEQSALAYLLHGKDARSLLPEPNRQQVATQVSKLNDDALWNRLRELAHSIPSLGVSEVTPGEVPRYAPAVAQRGELRARNVARPIASWQRTASFTELARRSDETRLGAAEGRDHDEGSAAHAWRDTSTDRCRLADFPGGARAGNFFHAVLEHWDFSTELLQPRVEAELRAHGFPTSLAQLASAALGDVVATPLPLTESPWSLSRIDGRTRLNELEFFLPVSARSTFRSGDPRDGTVTPEGLASAFARHPSREVPSSYADELATLRFARLHGFLKGYIDLVFRHEGRWYLVDYKSNRLGDHYADYGEAAMSRCMAHSHYFLQYHLYAVALHRYLALTQAGYEYTRDFGGVYYLFLRGMRPGARSGVFFERPPLARLDALSAALTPEASP